ncbi:GntR family transcriptional regulator [Nocardia terpenica]|uniref:GntR family transcriptional regulator n=1 Tax=Nocardia terpenica TaxID=455432 RepID=UPI0009EDD5AA|nr:GntR family transcriptional regulator [Nocardia terpenica]NQE87322.1 GntR family transcriptional regulator [Nocardia terpenica]
MTGSTTTQSVTEQLRAKVLDGELASGSRLQERNLAQLLSVSRTPVRDSLQVLAGEGLLDYSPHSGYVVREFDLTDVLHAFDMRIALEGMACRALAGKPERARTLPLLHANLDRATDTVDRGEWSPDRQGRWLELNLEFHNIILAAAGNPYLVRGVEQARRAPLIYDARHRRDGDIGHWFTHDEVRQALADHRRIADALTDGPPDRAEFLMREHIYTNREQIRRHGNRTGE